MQHPIYLRRAEVRSVDCPACGAKAGAKCRWARGKVRESSHPERVAAATRKFSEARP